MKLPLLLAATTGLLCSPSSHALDAHCEAYLKAVEKTTAQPARHSVTDLGGGMRAEAIILGGRMYMQVEGRWMKGPANFLKAEQKLNADVRSGKYKLYDCKKLGRESVGGIATTVYSYQLNIGGLPQSKEPAKAYIGDDGLIHAQASDGTKVRTRFTGVTAPKL